MRFAAASTAGSSPAGQGDVLSHAGTFLMGFGTAWAIGLLLTHGMHNRAGGSSDTDDLLVSLVTPSLPIGFGVALLLWG